MKRCKKYVLCAICACCVGLLAGCGNKNDGTTGNENTTGENMTGNENATEAITEKKESQRETAQPATNDSRMTEPGDTAGEARDDTVNDVTDPDDANTGAGGAAKDIVDGVGDAGKDIVDGVEDAGDALTGEDTNRNTAGE